MTFLSSYQCPLCKQILTILHFSRKERSYEGKGYCIDCEFKTQIISKLEFQTKKIEKIDKAQYVYSDRITETLKVPKENIEICKRVKNVAVSVSIRQFGKTR